MATLRQHPALPNYSLPQPFHGTKTQSCYNSARSPQRETHDHNVTDIRLVFADYRHFHSCLPEPFHLIRKSSSRLLKRSYLGMRGFTLMLFQLPLWTGMAVGAFQANLPKTGVFAAAAACLGYATWLTRSYFLECRRNYIQTGEISSKTDKRPLALGFVGLGTFAIASYAFRQLISGGIMALLGSLGYYLRYMLPDPDAPAAAPERIETDHLNPTLRQMINNAYGYLDNMRDVQRRLRLRPQEHDVAMQLQSIILHSRRLIAIMAEQPERIRAARQFLVVQLAELSAISRAYLEDDGAEHEQIRNNYLALLQNSETALFQEKRLLDHNRFQTLDTRMQVLREQLQIKAETHE